MCETLRVAPNELLGFADLRHHPSGVPGLAETSLEEISRGHDGEASGKGADPVSSMAWNPAAEAVGIRQEHGGRSKAAVDPLAVLRETGALVGRPQAEPFQTVAAMLGAT